MTKLFNKITSFINSITSGIKKAYIRYQVKDLLNYHAKGEACPNRITKELIDATADIVAEDNEFCKIVLIYDNRIHPVISYPGADIRDVIAYEVWYSMRAKERYPIVSYYNGYDTSCGTFKHNSFSSKPYNVNDAYGLKRVRVS